MGTEGGVGISVDDPKISIAWELLVLIGSARSVGKFMEGVGDHNPTPLGALKRGSFWSNTPIAQERLTNATTNPQIITLCDLEAMLRLSVDCILRVITFPGFDRFSVTFQ